tara:strand:- start:173 stop:388 length:216 start_codon:yes stop_codon:yes gene_type:complete
MEEIRKVLIDNKRYDLVAILNSLLDEIEYSTSDEDYSPPGNFREPKEEYMEGDTESDYEIDETEDGFKYIA